MPTPLDTSMYARAAVQPNPLGQIAQFAQTQNALNQNRLFQQTFAARQAVGGIMQQAVDPQTGAIDYNKAAVMLSTNPATAFLAPDILNAWQQKQLVQQQTIAATLGNAQKRFGAIGNAAAALVQEGHANGDKVDLGKVVSATALLKGQGLIDDESQMNFLARVGKDPSQIYQHLLAAAQQAQGAEKSLSNTFKALSTPAGGYTQIGTQNVYSGRYMPSAGGVVEHSPSPETLNKPTPYVNAQTGQKMEAPQAAVMPTYGGLGSTVSTPGQLYGGNATGAVSQGWTPNAAPLTGKPGQSGVTVQGPAGQSVGSAVPGSPGVPTALAPGQESAIKQVTEKYAPDLNARAANANQLKLLIDQAQDETKNFKQGGGTAEYMKMGQLAQALGLSGPAVDALANGSLASSQAANKLFMQVGSMVANQLVHAGGGRLTQTEWSKVLSEGAANINLDPKAISKILGAMREAIHYTELENQAYGMKYRQYKSGQYDIGQFPQDWQSTLSHVLDQRRSPPNGR